MFNTEKHVKSIDFSYNSILYQYPLSKRERAEVRLLKRQQPAYIGKAYSK